MGHAIGVVDHLQAIRAGQPAAQEVVDERVVLVDFGDFDTGIELIQLEADVQASVVLGDLGQLADERRVFDLLFVGVWSCSKAAVSSRKNVVDWNATDSRAATCWPMMLFERMGNPWGKRGVVLCRFLPVQQRSIITGSVDVLTSSHCMVFSDAHKLSHTDYGSVDAIQPSIYP
jgi:hypothetical protein